MQSGFCWFGSEWKSVHLYALCSVDKPGNICVGYIYIYLKSIYTNTVLDGCVLLSVRYRNHIPVAAGALTGAPKAPKGSAVGATPPEGEGNPAEGGSSRVYS